MLMSCPGYAELLLDEEQITEAFRLRATRTAAEPREGKLELDEGETV